MSNGGGPAGKSTPKIAELERRHGRPLPGLLTDLYVIKGLSEAEVGRVLGVAQNQVHRWMVRYGIPRRTVRAFASDIRMEEPT